MKLVLGSRRFNSVAAYGVQDEESTRYEFDSQRPLEVHQAVPIYGTLTGLVLRDQFPSDPTRYLTSFEIIFEVYL